MASFWSSADSVVLGVCVSACGLPGDAVCDNPRSACCEPDQLMVYVEGVNEGDWIVRSEG